MASDVLLSEFINIVKTWTKNVSDAVYVEAPSLELPSLSAIENRDSSYFDIGPSWPLSGLPKPLQTLMIALKDLKEDIVRDKLRQISNYENKIIYNLESAVSNINNGLQKLSNEIHNIVSNQDQLLEVRKEIDGLGGDGLGGLEKAPEKISEWRQYLLGLLRDSLAKETPYITKKPTERPEATSLASSRAIKAAEESRQTRLRLKALAEGPLKSLFEHSVGPCESEPKDVTLEANIEATVASLPAVNAPVHSDKIKKIIRHFERNRRIALSTQRDLLDVSVNNCSKFIKNIKFLDKKDLVITVPDEMKNADLKIQTEIKFIIQTLSVNMKTLDEVLKYIKQFCASIESQTKAETIASYYILATKWRLQIIDSYEQTREAYKAL